MYQWNNQLRILNDLKLTEFKSEDLASALIAKSLFFAYGESICFWNISIENW